MGLNNYADIIDAPLSDLSRQDIINTENQFMAFYDSSWQDCPETGRSTGAYIIFYQGGTIDHGTNVPGPFSQSKAESEYNTACNTGMDLAHFRILIHEFLRKDPDIVPEEDSKIILDIKSAVCMAKNGKYTKNTRNISRRVQFVRNVDKRKMHKIEWCEGGLQLENIATKNVGENDLNTRMRYIMFMVDN